MCVCVYSAYLCSLMALQSHADVKVAVAEAEAVLGGAEQAELSFICGFRHKHTLCIMIRNSIASLFKTSSQKYCSYQFFILIKFY